VGHFSIGLNTQGLVPVFDIELAGDDRGSGGIAVIEDFQQVPALAISEATLQAPVIQDQDIDSGQLPHESGIAAVAAADLQFRE
jgi:hypothetical protein